MSCYTPVNKNNCFSNVYIRELVRGELQAAAECFEGDSAYTVAVKNGFVGTEDEWLASLGGTISDIKAFGLEAGSAPSANLGGTPRNRVINLGIPKGVKGEKGEDGEDGKSTYELSVDYGFIGSERQWLTGIANDTTLVSNLYADMSSIEEAVNGDENTIITTRLGTTYPSIKSVIEDTVTRLGFVTIDSFELGATITQRNQALRHEADGKLYRWAGDLPKSVSTYSTPSSSGGMGYNAWLEVSDTALRQDLKGDIANGLGATLVKGAALKVDSKESLRSVEPSAGLTVFVGGSHGGVFEYRLADYSNAVLGDSKNHFFIAPNSDNTGSRGAWVRASGVPVTDTFSSEAPEGSRLFSTIDAQEYVFSQGSWEKVNKALSSSISGHIQDPAAHGLKLKNLALGLNSTATGASSVSVGDSNISEGSYVLGRENQASIPFSAVLGRNNISSTDSVAERRDVVLVGQNNTMVNSTATRLVGNQISDTNSKDSVVIGGMLRTSGLDGSIVLNHNNLSGTTPHINDLKNSVVAGRSCTAESSESLVLLGMASKAIRATSSFIAGTYSYVEDSSNLVRLGSASSTHRTTKYTQKTVLIGYNSQSEGLLGAEVTSSIAIGENVRVKSASSEALSNAIAIGTNTEAQHNNSIALGVGVTTTADNEIRIGTTLDNVVIDGSLNVTGSNSFKIHHPVPDKRSSYYLQHSSYVGDCAGGTIYRHHVTTVEGVATIELPDWFEYLNKDVVVYVTPHMHFGAAYGEVVGNTLTVTSNVDGEYNVLIMGTRKDSSVNNWQGVEVAK